MGDVDASAVTAGIDSAVEASNATVEAQVDAASVTNDIDAAVATADTTVTVDAITDQVTADIEEAVAAADTTISVDAGGTSDQLSDIAGAAATAGGGLDDLTGKAAIAGSALRFGAGETGALTGALGAVGPQGAIAAGALTAATFAGKQFFEAALDARTSLERFRDVFGPFASDIEHIDINGLNIDLKDLAVNLGSDDDALRQAASNFAVLGLAAGRSQSEVAGSAEQLLVLASAIAAANPALGTTEEVITRLGPALARGGRFAAQFGVDLDRAEIAARAVANANGDASAATDQFALRQAGLQLALEQLPDVAARIEAGFDKPIVKLRAFQQQLSETAETAGGPLVDPVIDGLTSLEPILSSVARIIGAGLNVVLRLLVANLRPFIPLLQLAAKAAELLARGIELVVDKVGDFAGGVLERAKSGLRSLIETFNRIPLLPNISTEFLESGNNAGAAVGPVNAFAGAIGNVATLSEAANAQLDALFGNAVGFVDAQQGLVQAQRNVRNAQEGINGAISAGGGATESATERYLKLRSAEFAVVDAQNAHEDAIRSTAEAQKELNELFTISDDEMRAIEDAQRGVENAQRGYREATERVIEAQQRLAEVTRAATTAEADQARRDRKRAELSEADAIDRLEEAQARRDAANLTLQRSVGRSQRVQSAAAEQASDAEREYQKAVLDSQDATARKREAQKEAADVLDGTVGTTEQATEAERALADAKQAQTDAARASADADRALAEAYDATRVSAGELETAERNLERAHQAEERSALAVEQANFALQQAHDGTSGSAGRAAGSANALRDAHEALADAQRALVPALAATKDQQDLLADGTLTAQERAENLISSYREVANSLDPGNPLRQNLLDTANFLQENFDRDYNTVVNVDISPAGFNKFVDELNGALFAGAPVFPKIAGAMAGINDFSGGFLKVGERGPEIMYIAPNQSATVIPSNESDQFARAMSERPINVTVNEVAGNPEATAFAVGARLGELSQR